MVNPSFCFAPSDQTSTFTFALLSGDCLISYDAAGWLPWLVGTTFSVG